MGGCLHLRRVEINDRSSVFTFLNCIRVDTLIGESLERPYSKSKAGLGWADGRKAPGLEDSETWGPRISLGYATTVVVGATSNGASVPAASSACLRCTSKAMSCISKPIF